MLKILTARNNKNGEEVAESSVEGKGWKGKVKCKWKGCDTGSPTRTVIEQSDQDN
jgi:hypothetical protein